MASNDIRMLNQPAVVWVWVVCVGDGVGAPRRERMQGARVAARAWGGGGGGLGMVLQPTTPTRGEREHFSPLFSPPTRVL